MRLTISVNTCCIDITFNQRLFYSVLVNNDTNTYQLKEFAISLRYICVILRNLIAMGSLKLKKLSIKALAPLFASIITLSSVIAQDNSDAFKYSRIKIDAGNTYTNSLEVTVSVVGPEFESIVLSNTDELPKRKWIDFDRKITWLLTPGDGKKVVYAKIKDRDGNESEVLMDEIILDSTPPSNPSVKFLYDKEFYSGDSLGIKVEVSAVDAEYFIISNAKTFHAKRWRRIGEENNTIDWQLEAGDDGPRYVYAKFMDKAKNETETVFDMIVLDRLPPFDGKVQIDGGQRFATAKNRQSNVFIFAREADSMKVSLNESFDEAKWEVYSTSKTVTFSDEDGIKSVYVVFKDKAGNMSKPYRDDIISDTTPPRNCSIEINNGDKKTKDISKYVTLQLKAEGVSFMKISNDPSFNGARWKNYVPKLEKWQLDGERDGRRTVYVQFRDAAGNVSETYKESIKLERGVR